jgi:peptide methionine sulfoxide reductase msrA/msrB
MDKTSLTPEQRRVALEGGTEPPFANAYWNNHEPGVYLDVVSGDLLFRSEDKYDSGSGWPSFTKPASSDALVEREDRGHGMVRTEVRAAKSGIHLGHVFDDGPRPRGLRYCMNSAALRFVPEADSTAYFAAGCFWGTEAYFRRVGGVLDATAGYMGGEGEDPDYAEVSTGLTGHAETVRVTFDPARVTYRDLVRHFFRMHDPTTPNRQGNDRGTQYRSAVFYLNELQRETVVEVARELAVLRRYDAPIVTEILPSGEFWPAEEYHQRYLDKNPLGYCHVDLDLADRPLD